MVANFGRRDFTDILIIRNGNKRQILSALFLNKALISRHFTFFLAFPKKMPEIVDNAYFYTYNKIEQYVQKGY
jgi:hypothetical protein